MTGSPVTVAVAPNGARRTTQDHPGIPVTPEALADCAVTCRAAGASMLHLHVRDEIQAHVLDAGRYREALAAIREVAGDDLLVQATTEAVGRYSPDEQMALVRDLRPEAISLALRELLPEGAETTAAADFLTWAGESGIAVQYILYTPEEAARLCRLKDTGTVPEGAGDSVLFVLGRYGQTEASSPAVLLPFLNAYDQSFGAWMVCAFGVRESECAMAAAVLGGHARIGFENNLLRADGTTAADNAAQVARFRDALNRVGRPLADGVLTRSRFGAGRGLSVENLSRGAAE